jgi:OOP family OmpA-OmpF porin
MKKAILSILFLCAVTAHAQEKNFNQFSIELSFGLNSPLSPSDNSGYDVGEFGGFRHFDIGGRYMFNRYYGVKMNFSYDKFQHKDLDELSVAYKKISAEFVLNVSQALNFYLTPERIIQIQTHSGFGITFAKPASISNNERIGNLIIGVNPQVKISERIAITTDFSYNFIFKQHFDYAGNLINPDYEGVTGSFINFSLGLQFYLGKQSIHADWY